MAQFRYRRLGSDREGSERWCALAMAITEGVGSIAVTDAVDARRAAEEEKMPPPQPMSRYECFFVSPFGLLGLVGSERDWWRQELMKSWRRGFMRCRRREGPCGSHHEAARREKCETSVADTEEVGAGGGGDVSRERGAVVEYGVRAAGR